MRQRGRRSAQSLGLAVSGSAPYLEPPGDLTPEELALFREIVGSCKPTHFVPSDRHLVVAYVQATLLSREGSRRISAGDVKALVIFERTSKLMGILATKLRLAPQSRIDARRAESRTRRQSSAALLMSRPHGEETNGEALGESY